jgi:hypothetical protein
MPTILTHSFYVTMVCFLQVPSENMDHLPEPAVELWQKVLPLGMIFFCASFNLTILQVQWPCAK